MLTSKDKEKQWLKNSAKNFFKAYQIMTCNAYEFYTFFIAMAKFKRQTNRLTTPGKITVR